MQTISWALKISFLLFKKYQRDLITGVPHFLALHRGRVVHTLRVGGDPALSLCRSRFPSSACSLCASGSRVLILTIFQTICIITYLYGDLWPVRTTHWKLRWRLACFNNQVLLMKVSALFLDITLLHTSRPQWCAQPLRGWGTRQLSLLALLPCSLLCYGGLEPGLHNWAELTDFS